MLSGGLLQARWHAVCWHGCNSTNNTKAKTRNSAAVKASSCPMAAGVASIEENPSNRSRTIDVRLFESGEMCIEIKPNKTMCTEINQTKQIGEYNFMENIFRQQGSNSHPEGMCHC
jgi:hypothetical protein